jgi:hypothetical protein
MCTAVPLVVDMPADDALVDIPQHSIVVYHTPLTKGTTRSNTHYLEYTLDAPHKFTASHLSPRLDHQQVYELHKVSIAWDRAVRHTIDAANYSVVEAQFVMFDAKYDSIEDAKNQSSAIAVMSVLFKLALKDNQVLDQMIFSAVDADTFFNGNQTKQLQVELHKLLPEKYESRYFFYNSTFLDASLDCVQAVEWIVFSNFQTISISQLNKLRKFKYSANGSFLASNLKRETYSNPHVFSVSWLEHSGQGPTGNTYILGLFFILSCILITIGLALKSYFSGRILPTKHEYQLANVSSSGSRRVK